MQDKLRAIEARYEELNEQMGQPEVLADYQRLQELAIERSAIDKVVSLYRRLSQIEGQLEEARQLTGEGADPEIARLAREELQSLEPARDSIEDDLKLALLPTDPHDDRDVIVEIRAGTGGEEAALFAADLFRMYSRYAETRKLES